jgi:aspartate/methionine/tyrosine aminotransferase
LSHSDCEPLSAADLLDEHELAEFAGFRLGDGTFDGLNELRRAVAGQYESISPEDVLVFSGASEAIYTFMRTMLNSGDEVVVQTPLFNTLHGVARAIGCHIIEWRPADERGAHSRCRPWRTSATSGSRSSSSILRTIRPAK